MPEQKHSLLDLTSDIAGIGSLILAVLQANMPVLEEMQRWGLAMASGGLI